MIVVSGIICLLAGLFGLVHQKLTAGMWFTWEQFWCHESLIVLALWTGILLIIIGGYYD